MFARLLVVVALGLSGCSAPPAATDARTRASDRLDQLENRVAALERAAAPSRAPGPAQAPAYPPDAANGTEAVPANSYDQQEYERQVQALCASKGVDCSR